MSYLFNSMEVVSNYLSISDHPHPGTNKNPASNGWGPRRRSSFLAFSWHFSK